jgi:hypothetical protein
LNATTKIYLLLQSLFCKYAKGTAFEQINYMQIQNKQTERGGMFYVPGSDDNILAELTYSQRQNNTMIIEHTEVSDELRGQNVGYDLVNAAVEHARSEQMKIVAVCSFANAIISRKPEFKDMLEE